MSVASSQLPIASGQQNSPFSIQNSAFSSQGPHNRIARIPEKGMYAPAAKNLELSGSKGRHKACPYTVLAF
jgi:hypothetical protein